jgi:polyhydroxybutyrate depolymerase
VKPGATSAGRGDRPRGSNRTGKRRLSRSLVALCILSIVLIPSLARASRRGESITLTVGAEKRAYLLARPNRRLTKPRPLVIQLHGGRGTGRGIDRLTNFNELGKKKGFLVASPDGIGGNWNDGRENLSPATTATTANIDDVAFLDEIIDDVSRRASVDKTRVFVVGISNGAFMANRYACERSERVAGIGLVAGTMSPTLRASCKPTRPVRVIDFHGTDDPLVLYDGGVVAGDKGESIPVDNMLAVWSSTNRCGPQATMRVDRDLTIRDWSGCITPVRAYRVERGGHTWPGGPQYLPRRIIGRTTNTVNATNEIWAFFSGNN